MQILFVMCWFYSQRKHKYIILTTVNYLISMFHKAKYKKKTSKLRKFVLQNDYITPYVIKVHALKRSLFKIKQICNFYFKIFWFFVRKKRFLTKKSKKIYLFFKKQIENQNCRWRGDFKIRYIILISII